LGFSGAASVAPFFLDLRVGGKLNKLAFMQCISLRIYLVITYAYTLLDRQFSRLCVSALGVLLMVQPGQADEVKQQISDTATKIQFNNGGVIALNRKQFDRAIDLLEQALVIDRSYKNARLNLFIAINQAGQNVKDNPDQAIKYFHRAEMLF